MMRSPIPLWRSPREATGAIWRSGTLDLSGSNRPDPGLLLRVRAVCIVKALQHLERHAIERMEIGAFQNNPGRHARCQRFNPSQDTQAPLVTRLQARESRFRYRGCQVIATLLTEFEKCLCHDGTDDMRAMVFRIGLATTIPKETSQWLERAGDNGFAKYISCR